MSKIVLDIKNISFSYENQDELIKNISLTLKENDFLSIVGSSGCGKSTIIKLISGIETISSGEIFSEKTAYMPQKDLLLPWRTVLENILLPTELNNFSNKKNKQHEENALFYLEKFKLLQYKNNFPYELSGGMRQRVSFIRTLLTDANIFLLDEPFSALDAITKENLQQWLFNALKDINKTIIFITHDINEALFLSNRILVCQNKPLNTFIEYSIPQDKKTDLTFMQEVKNSILSNIREDN